MNVFLWCIVIGAVLLVGVWLVNWALKKWWPGASISDAGLVIGKIADITQSWTAYQGLTAIRAMDCVEADEKAIESCDYLRQVITAWQKVEDTKVAEETPVSVDTLVVKVAELEAKIKLLELTGA